MTHSHHRHAMPSLILRCAWLRAAPTPPISSGSRIPEAAGRPRAFVPPWIATFKPWQADTRLARQWVRAEFVWQLN
ncbi:MAG TPA: hypothetical protein VF453_11325 [Burkholderiaceae bacterium]